MRISIVQESVYGASVFVEAHHPTTNANGLVSIEIGSGTVAHGDMASIDWMDGPYFLKTETDPTGGTNYSITGISQILSVPYALHAKSAEMLTTAIEETDPVFTAWDRSEGIVITEAQISDLQAYLTEEVDPMFAAWDKSEGIVITESQISDLKAYLTEETQHLADVLALGRDAGGLNITNLADPANAQDASTKAYVDKVGQEALDAAEVLLARIEALEEDLLLASGFADPRDNNRYQVVRIGEQLWMAENLRYLPSVVGPDAESENSPHYYVYGYDGTSLSEAKTTENYRNYGVLYNWPAAMAGASSSDINPSGVQGVCPPGWHLPSFAEWSQLIAYLFDQGTPNTNVPNGAGNALKSCRGVDSPLGGDCNTTDHPRWNRSTNNYGRDKFGFAALPGGSLHPQYADYTGKGVHGFWWSTTEVSDGFAYPIWISLQFGLLGSVSNIQKSYGLSVRCVRDDVRTEGD